MHLVSYIRKTLRKSDIGEKGKKYRGYFPIVHGSIIPEASYREAMVLHRLGKSVRTSDSVALYVHIFRVGIMVFFE